MAIPAPKPDRPCPEEVLIFAPTGQDAQLLARVLESNGLNCQLISKMPEISGRLQCDAGALLLAEEALHPLAMQELNRVLSAQEAWSDIPIVVMTSGGETTFASRRVLRDFAPAGNVTLLERPFRPITLLSTIQVALRSRRRQFEVRSLLERQREATRLRDEFISIASHELKTPLTSLKLQTQINKRFITRGSELDSAEAAIRFQKYLEGSGQQLERLARLIEDMLDVSRINAGKLLLQKTETDLSELIHEVVDRISPQITASGCTLELRIAERLPGLWDRYRIEQVLINLLTNAFRYGGGKTVEITASRQGQFACVRVKDQGMGIAPEDQEKIFLRFERAPQTRNIDGLGLGLYICREIVTAHDGSIEVESVLGDGAAFTVKLPL